MKEIFIIMDLTGHEQELIGTFTTSQLAIEQAIKLPLFHQKRNVYKITLDAPLMYGEPVYSRTH